MKRFKSGRILTVTLILAILSIALIISALAIGTGLSDDPELRIAGTNLSFSDSIYIKYAVATDNVAQIEDVVLLVWNEPDDSYVYGNQDAILNSDGTVKIGGKECLVFDYCDIAAKEMTDYVYARAYYKSGNNEYYSDVKKYSVLTYAYNMLGYTGEPTQNEDLASLLRGLLDYGASAQNYFDYKEDALANDTHVKVTLENATFADGSNYTLAIPGTKLTVIAPPTVGESGFLHWTDSVGKTVSSESTFELTVGSSNVTLSAVYVSYQGGYLEGAGTSLSEDSYAMTDHTVNLDSAVDLTASELEALLISGLEASKTYRVTDGNAVKVTSSISGNGAAIIAPAGLVFNSVSNVTISDIIILAPVTISESANITFTQVDVQSGDSAAITLDSSSDNIKFDTSRISTTATAVSSSASNFALLNSYVKGGTAVDLNGNGSTVYNCFIISDAAGITVSAEDTAVNNNTITAISDGIHVADGSVNTLVYYNSISGVEESIKVGNATNTSVLFNSTYSIAAENSTNTYIVENSLNGRLVLTNNDYLLCDENSYANDGKDHSPTMSGNENVNGNNLMDVNARNEVGAKEDLLPHTNKDLFLDMTVKTTVKDAVGGTSLSLGEYIRANAETNDIVIVPPGYYTVDGVYTYTSAHSNTRVYAYGVYNETVFHDQTVINPSTGNVYQNTSFQFGGAKNVEIHGITVGYNHQSAGQAHVLTKSRSGNSWSGYTYKVTLVSAAGYESSFGSLDSGKFSSGSFDLVKQGEIHWSSYSYSALTANSDGTMTMTVSESAYNNITAGDVLYCRLAGDNQQTIYLGSGAENITFKDCTVYGYAAGLAFVGAQDSNGATLERVHNTVHSAYIIDKATYDKYDAWESSYGVELVSIDSEGRYRGTTPIVGSVDATHLNGADKGFHAISCLFENMCDDGSNHRGSSSRLHGYRVNNDGTVTLYVKGNVSEYYRGDNINKGKTSATASPVQIDEGDNIYIYTSKGELFCDTVALNNSVNTNTTTSISYNYTYGGEARTLTYTIKIYEVNVSADACNFAALDGYDLSNNDYTMSQKVLVDNISRNSTGGHFDNVLVQNTRSRGFLVKSTDITIENCTFRNLALTSVLMSIETTWGESTVARNVIVRNTLFDSTGFRSDSFDSQPTYAPIAISSLTTYGDHSADALRAENITIEGNEFRNYGHSYGIYVNGAKNVHILNNVFKPLNASTQTKYVEIITAADIEISGNKDASGNSITISQADDAAYIHGDNVSGSSLSDTDIFINGTHMMYYHVVAENEANNDIAASSAISFSGIDGYMIRSSKKQGEFNILLVARDNTSDALSDKSYTVACNGNTLTITAQTRGALAYATSDFAQRLSALNLKTYEIKSGESATYTFTTSDIPATDTSLFKYVGMWQATDTENPTTMVSYWDSAYVEFDFTGTSATLLFSSPTTCNVSIDGGDAHTYTVQDELTVSAATSGTHTVRIHYGDKSAHIYFAGVRLPDGETVSRTADKPFYIQFVGDSISDASSSFSHNTAALLGWDYSVIACEALSLQANKGYWRYNNGFSNDGGYAEGSMAYHLNQNFGTESIGMEDAFFKLGIPNKSFPAAGSDEFNDIAANYYTEKYDFNFNTGYTPDIVFIFLGTNDLSSGSTQTDINNFVAKYKEFVANILAVYGNDTKICAMQALSTSDSADMYNTSHPRYVAIAQAASELEALYGDKFNFIDAATVQSWNVEISSDSTHPTERGYATLTSNIAKYLYNAYVDQSFINHSFDISAIRKYQSSWGNRDSSGTDNGLAYSHFSFTSTGHINISGKNDNSWSFSAMTNYNEDRAVTINGSTGQYLVLMYRASGNDGIGLELRTTSADDKSSKGTDTLSKVTKPSGLVSAGWEFAVVDLSQFANYTCNTSNLRVQVRITTAMTSFDIAYCAIVDNIDEATQIARFKLGMGKMVVYNDFSATGEKVYLTEEAYQEDLKASLDYVNLIYNTSTFKKYESGTNATTDPDVKNGVDADGTKFIRFSFATNGHVFFNGANGAVSTNGSGRYFIMKYRAVNNTSHITFEATTSDKNSLSKITKDSALMPSQWEIAVVDLSQFASYTCNSDNNAYIRFTSTCENLDISFAAIVDDLNEAADYISVVSPSDTSYVLYTNWAASGTVTNLPD